MPGHNGEKMKHTPQSLTRRKVRSTVDWSSCGQTLINYLVSRFPYRDEPGWRSVISSGEITVNSVQVPPEHILAMHDCVEYQPGELPEPPADMTYDTVFEDEHLLVINKPGNLCVHPAGPFFKHTLWHMLCSKYGDIHFVNRLDRETSGLMIAAKTKETAAKFAKRDLIRSKIYTVMVHGDFDSTVRASGFLTKDTASTIRKKRRFLLSEPEMPSETAETLLEPLSSNGRFSLVRATLFTGRMHQIRATLYSMGYPVTGDKLYGTDERFYLKLKEDALTEEDKKQLLLPRQALHAARLVFEHPHTGELLDFETAAPFSLPCGKIAVTGSAGFIGSFFVRELEKRGIPFCEVPRDAFDSAEKLSKALEDAGCVVHFAGLSRHEDGEYLYRTNLALAEKLSAALAGKNTTVFLASSPHVLTKDLPYHRSKRDCMALFAANGIKASALLMPNTFGPGSKPFYNSVVSTFACLAAQGKTPERIDDVILELIPVRELCAAIADVLDKEPVPAVNIAHSIELPLPELWKRLNRDTPQDILDDLLLECRQQQ